MVVQIVQETLEDVPRDKSTNVKADSMTTVQNADNMAIPLNRRLVEQEIPAASSKRQSIFDFVRCINITIDKYS